jgi:DNA-binding response OmpR family regulator
VKILVVDDETAMRVALIETLRTEGYHAEGADNGEDGLEKAFASSYDLILLDVMMPRIDGFTACSEMRKRGLKTPVLMLTARGMVDDRVKGLDSGADDYLVKPFSLKELLARVRALTRRKKREEVPEEAVIGEATINFKTKTSSIGQDKLDLNTKECGILKLLIAYQGETVSRDQFLDEVWDYHASPSHRTVDNFIAELRKKAGTFRRCDQDRPRRGVSP